MKATVKRNDGQQGNIFKQGNLMFHKSGYLVLVTKDAQEHESIFEGVQIDGAYANGTFMPDWYKANFSLFSGSVLLEQ